MRQRAFLVLLIVALFATAGAAGATTARVSVPPPAPLARIAGHTHDCGGPPPGRCWKQPWSSVVVIAHHHVVAEEKSDRHGWFRFDLPPGRYKVRLKGLPSTTKTVNAKAGRTVHVKLYGSVP